MPGRTSTSWKATWTARETTVIRIPSHLKAQVLTITRHLDQGGQVQLEPLPDLFTKAPKARKPRKPAKGLTKPGAKSPRKRKPVTG